MCIVQLIKLYSYSVQLRKGGDQHSKTFTTLLDFCGFNKCAISTSIVFYRCLRQREKWAQKLKNSADYLQPQNLSCQNYFMPKNSSLFFLCLFVFSVCLCAVLCTISLSLFSNLRKLCLDKLVWLSGFKNNFYFSIVCSLLGGC